MVVPRVVGRRVVVGCRGGGGCVVGSPCVSRRVSRRLLSVGGVSCVDPDGGRVGCRPVGRRAWCVVPVVACLVLLAGIVPLAFGVLSAECPVSSCVSSCLSCWLRRVVLVVLVVLRLGERRVSRRVALG